MTKITPDHLARGAFIYIRQSTADQTRWTVETENSGPDSSMRAIDARQRHCRLAQSDRKTNGPAERMDAIASTWLPQHARHVYAEGEWAKRGEITLNEAANILNLSALTVLRKIHAGVIPATQYCKGAPWVIKRRDIEDQDLVARLKTSRKSPPSPDPDQQILMFQ